MSGRAAWFAYSRPRPGKLSARPIHPIGWALLFGLPLPALAAGLLLDDRTGRLGAGAVSAVVLAISLGAFFHLVVSRGRQVD